MGLIDGAREAHGDGPGKTATVIRLPVAPEAGSPTHRAGDQAMQRVFAHWVFMMEKNAKRCALGPTRRRAIQKALALYDEETLLLAIEGCAASAFHRGENDRDKPFDDLELILRDEAHIERFAEDGERLRHRLRAIEERRAKQAEEAKRAAERQGDSVARNPVDVQAERAKLRALAASVAGRSA